MLDRANQLGPLRSVVVSLDGKVVAARGYHGGSPDTATNIKSASKSIISALVGIAIDKGVLEGVDQKIAPMLARDLPDNPDPRINEITIGNLLSMQAGLGRMSGPNYGRWVSSRNWVRAALAEPFDGDPGGAMLYSTGSTHLLSAILTRTSGRSTRELAREWLGPVEGFSIGAWDRDPQGIYVGGNQMAMTPRSLLAFGELYRNGGRNKAGEQVVPENWIAESWRVRTNSIYSGDGYGYGWFQRADRRAGRPLRLGFWRTDALHRAGARADGGDDVAGKTILRRAAATATICTRCLARSSARWERSAVAPAELKYTFRHRPPARRR